MKNVFLNQDQVGILPELANKDPAQLMFEPPTTIPNVYTLINSGDIMHIKKLMIYKIYSNQTLKFAQK